MNECLEKPASIALQQVDGIVIAITETSIPQQHISIIKAFVNKRIL